jgi:hypothetical protein
MVEKLAPSTVFGFINAVKNTEKNERLSENVCMLIKKFEEAYKTLSKLRQKGIMITEEKHSFSYAASSPENNFVCHCGHIRFLIGQRLH